jgi:hypothetical protein
MITANQRIATALAFIDAMLTEFKAPAVLWSSGKDSMVLLHLVQRVRKDLPVVFFREPFQPRRYSFPNDIIMDWGLSVHEWPPIATAVCHRNDATSLIHRFQVSPNRTIDMPVDVVEEAGRAQEDPRGDIKPVCALDILRRPKGGFTAPWDLMFTGAKSCDVDQLAGPVPLSVSLARDDEGPAYAFPLRTWTDADIWSYIEANKVPFQMDRYEKISGAGQSDVSVAGEAATVPEKISYRERADKSGNPDYLIGCQRCLCPDAPATVFCPKLQCEINNVSDKVPRLDDILPNYMGKA